MLFNKMTLEQIYNEVKQDAFIVLPKRKQIMRTYKQKYKGQEMVFQHTTSRNNKYSIYFQPTINGFDSFVTTEMPTEYGKKVIILSTKIHEITELNTIMICDPHVFRRYKERKIKNEASNKQVIMDFLSMLYICPTYILDENNNTLGAQEIKPYQEYKSMTYAQEGIILGNIMTTGQHVRDCISITEMKTFVPHSMLNKNQQLLINQIKPEFEYMNKYL